MQHTKEQPEASKRQRRPFAKAPAQGMPTEHHNDTSMSPEFMLQEYSALRERFHSLRTEGVNRLNFFLTLTSAIIGGVLVLGSGANLPPTLLESMLLAALILLAIVGIDVCQYMVTRDRITDRIERGMGRVRRYFVERDPSLANFIVHPYHDEPTSYLASGSRGVRRTAQTVQSFTVGLAAGIAADLVNIRTEYAVLIGVISFTLNFIILELYAKYTLRQALKKTEKEVKFPR